MSGTRLRTARWSVGVQQGTTHERRRTAAVRAEFDGASSCRLPSSEARFRAVTCPPPSMTRVRPLRWSAVSMQLFRQPTASTTGYAGTSLTIRFAIVRQSFLPVERTQQHGKSHFLPSRTSRP